MSKQSFPTPVGRPFRIADRCVCVQVLYALTAGIAGYVSAVQYKTMGGTNWVSTWLQLQPSHNYS